VVQARRPGQRHRTRRIPHGAQFNSFLTARRAPEFLTRTPMARFGDTQELVGAAIYLASDAASFVTGEIITVDGGFLAAASTSKGEDRVEPHDKA